MDNVTISDLQAKRVCTLSGVQGKLLEQRLVTLKDLEKSLLYATYDVSKAQTAESFWEAMIVSTKMVQAACDVSIAVLEEMTGPVGKGVSVLYDVSKLVVDALNGEFDAKEGFKFSANVHADAVLAVADQKGLKFAKVASRLKTMANLGDDLYDFFKKHGVGLTASGLPGAKRSAFGVLQRVHAQIAATEEALAGCTP